MAKVRILVGCWVDGEQRLPGDLIEVSDSDAYRLASMGRGVIDTTPEPEQATEPEAQKAVRKTSSKRTTASKGRRKKTDNS